MSDSGLLNGAEDAFTRFGSLSCELQQRWQNGQLVFYILLVIRWSKRYVLLSIRVVRAVKALIDFCSTSEELFKFAGICLVELGGKNDEGVGVKVGFGSTPCTSTSAVIGHLKYLLEGAAANASLNVPRPRDEAKSGADFKEGEQEFANSEQHEDDTLVEAVITISLRSSTLSTLATKRSPVASCRKKSSVLFP
jgi:hypothetical protein